MSTQDKKNSNLLTIDDAVNLLTHIMDMDFEEKESPLSEVFTEPEVLRVVNRVYDQDRIPSLKTVKEVFRVIFDYLNRVCDHHVTHETNRAATVEQVKTIMVLVGEAAKKLDKYQSLFQKAQHHKSITELKEYKQLQDLYLTRIERHVDEDRLGKWILALGQKRESKQSSETAVKRKSMQTKHLFIDLDAVKKDIEYELFFLRKDDGTRFFSPKLIRNLKLVSDFGDYLREEKLADPLGDIAVWRSRIAHAFAVNVMRNSWREIKRFYLNSRLLAHDEVSSHAYKMVMALLLAAHAHNEWHEFGLKNCEDYFCDCLMFLRETLHHPDYQKMIAYSPHREDKGAHALLDLIHSICMSIYVHLEGIQQFLPFVHNLIDESKKYYSYQKGSGLKVETWRRLDAEYFSVSKMMQHHSRGPIDKILNAFDEGECHSFDPFLQKNLPGVLYELYLDGYRCCIKRWPSPTTQEQVQQAYVVDEFKGFLRGCDIEEKIHKCLIINFQDSVSWKGYARCSCLEELANSETYAKHLELANIPKDTEFYYQDYPYRSENYADEFIKNFKEQLEESAGGFLFSEEWVPSQQRHFIDRALNGIHKVFFSNKNVLQWDERANFIEIFYLLLQLKLIDCARPDVVGFVCKDGVDLSTCSAAQMFLFLKLLRQERLSEYDWEQLDLMLYGVPLWVRERVMLPERFQRMVGAIKTIETARDMIGYSEFSKQIDEAFGPLYTSPLLHAKPVVHQPKSF